MDRAARDRRGRWLSVHDALCEPKPLQDPMFGTPEQCVELLKPYRELGVGDFLVLARPPLDEQTITLFAHEVAPALRAT